MKCPRVVTETYKDARTGEMRTRSYVRGRPLGKGGFAVVFSMQDPSTGESFAAKVVAKSTLEKDRARQKILTEIRIHRSVDNAHVVKFKKCFEDTNNVYILMELCSDKTLADVVKRRGRLTERECAPYLREIVAAVAHLHRERNVIHRDLKLGNVFLTPAGLDEASNDKEGGPGSDADLGANPRFGTRLKIGDFGLACRVAASGIDKKRITICGTPNYIAPETLAGSKGGGHSFEVDVWSIGVILYACLVGTPPFQTSDVRATYKRIRAGAYEFPKKDDGSGEHLLSSDARDLIAACLAPKPNDRPSLETIANHPTCRLGAPEWRLPETVAAAKETDGGADDDAERLAAAAERPPRVSPRAAALLAAGVADAYPPTPVSGESRQAPRAPLSPLPANLPARAAGRLKAPSGLSEKSLSEKSERRETPALAPPAQPAAFDVLEAQDVRAFDEHHEHRRSDPNRSGRANPKPRRAAEEGAPRSNAVPSVPSAPPASPSRRNGTVTSVSGRDAVGIPTSSLISVRAAPSAAALMSAGAESSSSLADDDEDVGARVAERIGGGDSAGAAERRRAASASAANVASIATFPPVWVTKWVDYTSKYGLGYRLSDGTFGVVFNDATKMSQASPSWSEKTDAENDGVASASLPPSEVSREVSKDTTACVTPPGDRLEYRERARRGSGSNPEPPGAPCVAFSAAAPPPSGLEKKTKLMRHFRGYLARDGRSAVERSAGGLFETCEANGGAPSNRRGTSDEREKKEEPPEVLPRAAAETARAAEAARARDSSRDARCEMRDASSRRASSVSAYLPHVKNWLRTKHAILFRLSNRTIQVNFTDGSEILLSSEAQACVFVDPKTGKRDAHLLAKLPADPELLRRLRYVKEVLHQLVHRAE